MILLTDNKTKLQESKQFARQQKEKISTLFESDFLLGVYDEYRMGGCGSNWIRQVTIWVMNLTWRHHCGPLSLNLKKPGLQLERNLDATDEEILRWINLLLAPGSSLGGARPKASVRGPNNLLQIEKFPSTKDENDTGAWEKVAMEIASQSGIRVTPCEARCFSGKQHTFLSQRFDRNQSGERTNDQETENRGD